MTFLARSLLCVGLLANSLAAFALPPVVTLVYPPQSAAFSAPATIPLAVSTTDPDGGSIIKVEYFLGGSPLGAAVTTAPFGATWSGVGAGTYTLSAKATDSQGEWSISSAATITVYSVSSGNVAPSVGVVLPISGSAYSLNMGPVIVPVLINATDAGSINRTELYINSIYLGSVPGGVLSTNIQFSSPGTYSIVARAYDNLGVSNTSLAATVNINATGTGNTAPTSNITSPLTGDKYLPPASIPITVAAADSGGSINRVEFYANGTYRGADFVAPYAGTLVGVGVGSYTLRVRAYDNLGVYTDSPNVQVVVNTPPSVNLTAPLNNAVINTPVLFVLQANATDADNNISKVEFYQGSTLIGEDPSTPYSWSLSNLAKGNYTFTAKVYDALGAVATSSVVNVLVNESPTIGLTASSAFGGYNAPADIVLTASPADVDGTVSKVEFYSGASLTPIATKTVSPYTHTVAGVASGTHTFTAKVYDNRSAVTTSNEVSVTVSPSLSPATFTYDELGRLVGVQH